MTIMINEVCVAGRGSGTATTTITPGCLICRDSSGGLSPFNVVGGACQKMFALEVETGMEHINYITNDTVTYKICCPGDQLSAFLADGETVVIGDRLCCAGNGVLQKISTSSDVALAIALEAMTASGDTAIDIEVI